MFLLSAGLVLFELGLTRLFGVVLFASYAHLALALALLGISVGAMLQQLWPDLVPEEGLERRLAWLSLLQGSTTVLAVLAAVTFPLTRQFDEAPTTYGERSSQLWELLDPWWFSALLPVLALPFAVVGLAFAGTFQRRKDDIGLVYGADLIGGGAGALAFIPLLYAIPAPDLAWMVLAVCGLSAVVLARENVLRGAGGAAVVVGLLGSALGSAGTTAFPVRYAAGYSEENVTYTKWTPLTRLAVHEDQRGIYMLLDNSSASEIITTEERREAKSHEAARSFVYHMHPPGSRIAILAASAGPEVAVAQALGHTGIDAIDIASEIGEVVARRWPDSDVNPYVVGDTHRVWSDGRAAILHAREPYQIIQMVHANLHSAAGLMANTWSPNLLETKEAFHTYFDKLSEHGTLSFSAHTQTRPFARAAAAALMERGVTEPERHIFYIGGANIFMLVKKRPFTPKECANIVGVLGTWRPPETVINNPCSPNAVQAKNLFQVGPVLTDDRPFFESPERFAESAGRMWSRIQGHQVPIRTIDALYLVLMLQTVFVVVSGSLLVLVPLLLRGSRGLGVSGAVWALAYVSCLGYGYLGVETVLVHELVLFVGHPVYAVTAVIFTMLVFSGLGSMLAGTFPESTLQGRLRQVLAAVVVLGIVQATAVPALLNAVALGLPMPVRVGLTGLCLAPLGTLMGMPFPLFLRVLRPQAATIVPWAWAFNGWTSVVASLATIWISRLVGFSAAFGVAIVAYAVAVALVGRIARVGE
ncbi:MAG: hypothetical protein H6736_04055 [Alphaproteobacteria bacterium]|nr:hypothetical protein [Alphaproteobacteria bacterium]MCB9690967.1 hypothetical protein [Alphaproteobacteria bacterium]